MATYDVKISFTVTNKDDGTISETSQTYQSLDAAKLLALESAVLPAVQNTLLGMGKARLETAK